MSKNKATGLTTAEVAERIERGEINRVARSDRAEYTQIVAHNLLTLFNALVVPAAIALFMLHELRSAAAVSGLAVINSAFGLVQEMRAKRHLDRLALLAEVRVRVVRDGDVVELPAGAVVRGDVVVLGSGDSVVADGELVEARFLEIDEALLTGESDAVPRTTGERVLSGSFAVAGEGSYVADGVGIDAYIHRTAIEARRYRFTASPLQTTINQLIRILTATAILLCLSYVVLWRVRDFSVNDLVLMMAATVTSMVPQGLVLMTTLAFVLAAVRMAGRGAIVQRLESVETMAAIDTLCMDKTGTLTTNNLKLEQLIPLDKQLDEIELKRRLQLFVSASLDRGNKSLGAIRTALGEVPVELVDLLPFKSSNRFSALRARDGSGEYVLLLGAPEVLQRFLPQEEAAFVEAARAGLITTGHRLLLFADAPPGPPLSQTLEGFVLRALALIALSDEMRPEAPAVLQRLARQGISFKVLSGDNPDTVRATMKPLSEVSELQYLSTGTLTTGADLEAARDPSELVAKRNVFGRVSPWQKVQVIVALKEAGHRVAMIGDGVNDVLPIKNADLGIAMGEGSRAARTVAGLVLETNRFDLLPAALDEGRTILRNLRRAGKLFLVKNVYTLMLIVATVGIFDMPFPFLPQQVTLLNLLTIGIPVLWITLSTESAAGPRTDFLHEVGWFALRTGIVIGAACLALQWHSARVLDESAEVQRTLVLSGLVLLGVTSLLRAVREVEAKSLRGIWPFYVLSAAAVTTFLATIYLRQLSNFFELVPLDATHWLRVLCAVIPAAALLIASDALSARFALRPTCGNEPAAR
jgi:cation-transporting ATPase E